MEDFEVESGDSDVELRRTRVDEKDDHNEVVEIKSFAAAKSSLSQGIRPGPLGLVFKLRIITF